MRRLRRWPRRKDIAGRRSESPGEAGDSLVQDGGSLELVVDYVVGGAIIWVATKL